MNCSSYQKSHNNQKRMIFISRAESPRGNDPPTASSPIPTDLACVFQIIEYYYLPKTFIVYVNGLY